MKKKNKKSLILILLLCITLGYAYLNSNLRINGTTEIAGNSWDIHFENVVPSNSNTVTPTVAPVAEPQDKVTKLTYSVSFNKPGDIYEFDVDVVNAGSIDAMIKLYTSTIKVGNGEIQNVSSTTIPSYLKYYVTYSDGSPIQIHQLLEANDSETVRVHVEYKKNISNAELEASAGKTIDFSVEIEYTQATDDAIEKPNYLECTYNGDLIQGAEYVNGEYTYRYKQELLWDEDSSELKWTNIEEDGWGVTLTNKDATTPATSSICSIINGKPIISTSSMYYGSKATEITILDFNTSNVTNMETMFNGATNIESIDLSNLNTSNVTNMKKMMYGTTSLETVNLDNWNLRSFTNASAGLDFFANSAVKDLSTKNWKIPNTFSDWVARSWKASNLDTLDVTNWDLSQTTNISGLFGGIWTNNTNRVQEITGLDTWDTSNLVDISQLFNLCDRLTSVDLSSWNTSNIENMTLLFNNATSLVEVNLSNWDTSKVTALTALFYGCSNLIELDLSSFDTSEVTIVGSMLSNCNKLEKLDLSNWDFRNITGTSGVNLTTFTYTQLPKLEEVKLRNTILAPDSTALFADWTNLKVIDLTNVNTQYVTSMFTMFRNCTGITSLDLSSFNTSNVTNMTAMFQNTTNLSELDLSSFDTSSVTLIDAMFINTGATTGYARTQTDADKLNASGGKPSTLTFVVKP